MKKSQQAILSQLCAYLDDLHSMPQYQYVQMQEMGFKIYTDTPEAVRFCIEYLAPYFVAMNEEIPVLKCALEIYFKDIASSPVIKYIFDYIEYVCLRDPPHLFNFDEEHFIGSTFPGSQLRLIYSPHKRDIFTFVDLQKPVIYILDAKSFPQVAQFTLIRVLRNLARYRVEHSTHYPLHAAAISLKGYSVLMTGEKYAGKTTMLTMLLTYTQAQFISNDRVSLDRDTYQVLGWPYSPGVRAGTIQMNILLQRYFQQLRNDPYPFNHVTKDTFRFPPQTFCQIFQKEIVPRAELQLIINPVYDAEILHPVATCLSSEKTFRLLTSQAQQSLFYDPWWQPMHSQDTEDKYYQKVAHLFPVIEIRQNEHMLRETCKLIVDLC